jgi:hypothetical protein
MYFIQGCPLVTDVQTQTQPLAASLSHPLTTTTNFQPSSPHTYPASILLFVGLSGASSFSEWDEGALETCSLYTAVFCLWGMSPWGPREPLSSSSAVLGTVLNALPGFFNTILIATSIYICAVLPSMLQSFCKNLAYKKVHNPCRSMNRHHYCTDGKTELKGLAQGHTEWANL